MKESYSGLVFNREPHIITLVTDGNPDVIIQPNETIENTLSTDAVISDSFYVIEEGDWYTKEVEEHGGRVEVI